MITPKTNWNSDDFFNYQDFNRIKNNLQELRNLSIKVFDEYNIQSLSDMTINSQYLYADDINTLENNLEKINSNTILENYGKKTIYAENGRTMTYQELNRLESAIADLYDKINNKIIGRRNLAFNFGRRDGGL